MDTGGMQYVKDISSCLYGGMQSVFDFMAECDVYGCHSRVSFLAKCIVQWISVADPGGTFCFVDVSGRLYDGMYCMVYVSGRLYGRMSCMVYVSGQLYGGMYCMLYVSGRPHGECIV